MREPPETVVTMKVIGTTVGGIVSPPGTAEAGRGVESMEETVTERDTITEIVIGREIETGNAIGIIIEVKTGDRVVVVDGNENRKTGN